MERVEQKDFIILDKSYKVKVSRTNNKTSNEIIEGRFIEECPRFYLFQSKSDWKECFLKINLNREYFIKE